eukprot:TRINITY_DN56314_c0_g1_i1.p1 TRINITY_DN56314_c0_g1~~TRINITY_DN56314_c0_g1_i1.p1  ORF type:complete len:275 (+),score=32.74 TRINITY_DN56314_c0_g1_i1:204-1028(+)
MVLISSNIKPTGTLFPAFLLLCMVLAGAVSLGDSNSELQLLDASLANPMGRDLGDGPSDTDSDGDGVLDSLDQCPDTPAGDEVDWTGCRYQNRLRVTSCSPSSADGPPSRLLDGDRGTFWDCHARDQIQMGSVMAFKGGRPGEYKHYCRDEDDKVRCESQDIGPHERFNLVKSTWGGGAAWPNVAIVGERSGKFCADGVVPGGDPNGIVKSSLVQCNRDEPGAWETFSIRELGDGVVAIQSGRTSKEFDGPEELGWRARAVSYTHLTLPTKRIV